MTVAALARVTVPVTASAALQPLLAGAPAAGVLLGAGERGAWGQFDGEIVLLAPPGGGRLPLEMEVPRAVLAGLEAGEPCSLAAGGLTLGEWCLRPARWWDPRPALPRVSPHDLRLRVAAALAGFDPAPDEGLGAALAAGDPPRLLAAARGLIGRGPGLTPLGDDVLTGALASALLLGEAAGNGRMVRLVTGTAATLDTLARRRTTTLSAALLRHACRGEVDQASAGLLLALAGRGDPAAARDGLLGLGHTSGRGLATGILAAAAAAGGTS